MVLFRVQSTRVNSSQLGQRKSTGQLLVNCRFETWVTSVFHHPNLTLVDTWIIGRLSNYV
ncbi:hypothetical protein Hdeb2414_s0001g00023441 [Helianthus debilis subsp. tardiflorus]